MAQTWFNSRKAAQVAAFFALRSGGRINLMKTIKLIYLAERQFLDRYEASILRDNMVSMDNGPVASKTYNHINGENTPAWREFISDRDNYDIAVSSSNITETDLDELSRAEERVLADTWGRFGDLDQWQLVKYTQEHCPEWEDPNGSSTPIPYSRIFKFLNKANPEELERKILLEREMESLLST